MELENSKMKPQAQTSSLSPDTLGPDWDLRNIPYLLSARVPFFPRLLGMHFSIPDSDWTHEVRASAYLRLQPSVTNVASALGTRVSLFKDAGARLKTEARVVILLPGMREMPSISSQDESGLDESIFFSPNSSCLLLLLNHRLIFFFFDTWSCYVAQLGLECSSRSGLRLQRAGHRVHRCPSTLLAWATVCRDLRQTLLKP